MAKNEKIQVVIISGLSGAGKTHAADWFEDKGYYCIDNMPPALIRNFLELPSMGGGGKGPAITRAAFVVDIRSSDFFDGLKACLSWLSSQEGIEHKILFMEASDRTLVKRYSETRRSHPLESGPVTIEVIERERELMEPVRRLADVVIDTSELKTAETNSRLEAYFGDSPSGGRDFVVHVMSFGYKKGIPMEADITFDVRFVPNPFYVPELKKCTGKDQAVIDYVTAQPIAEEFVDDIRKLLEKLIPFYIEEGKYHLNLAVGCTGGQHRSVVIADRIAQVLAEDGRQVSIRHRDLPARLQPEL